MTGKPETPLYHDALALQQDTEAFIHFPTARQLLEAPKMVIRLVRLLTVVARRVELIERRNNGQR